VTLKLLTLSQARSRGITSSNRGRAVGRDTTPPFGLSSITHDLERCQIII
jgi:hypothetical protein